MITQNALFGEGIYLSGELLVSLLYAPPSVTWTNSQLGDTVNVVAVCEVIDDPVAVVCQTKGLHFVSRLLLPNLYIRNCSIRVLLSWQQATI